MKLYPPLSRRFLRVWQRNWTVYRQSWKISFIPPLLEPLFYLLAFGVGLSALVGNIRYQGGEISYVRFIAPALIAITVMNSSFFENTYASFVRMYYQKTFDAMMATPLTVEEIIAGEIVWGATKAVIATAIMMVVISFFGLIRYPEGLLLLPLAFLGGSPSARRGWYVHHLSRTSSSSTCRSFSSLRRCSSSAEPSSPWRTCPAGRRQRRPFCRSPTWSTSPGPSRTAGSTPGSCRESATSPPSPR
ncbi:MAG: ABC transporter permease [Syntrophales bacterium]|nr:ABC transporter permease [Syntrophales bacterium]